MLIQPDKELLGDKHVKDAEAVAKLKEDNKTATAKLRIPNQDLLEDRAAALGIPLHPSVLISRLQKLDPKIIVEQGGVRNAVAVRYPRISPETGEMEKSYVTGFYVDNPLPEFSCVVVDNRGLPWREIRGWRSVLIALIRQNIVTEGQCDLIFGKNDGKRAVIWNESNYAQRNRK
jgi:hypothetical protein